MSCNICSLGWYTHKSDAISVDWLPWQTYTWVVKSSNLPFGSLMMIWKWPARWRFAGPYFPGGTERISTSPFEPVLNWPRKRYVLRKYSPAEVACQTSTLAFEIGSPLGSWTINLKRKGANSRNSRWHSCISRQSLWQEGYTCGSSRLRSVMEASTPLPTPIFRLGAPMT